MMVFPTVGATVKEEKLRVQLPPAIVPLLILVAAKHCGISREIVIT
jgi:hypothetical protein